MPNYKAMYLTLFNSITDTIEMLKQAQVRAEEMYIENEEELPESRRGAVITMENTTG